MKAIHLNRRIVIGTLLAIPALSFVGWGVLSLIFRGFGGLPKDCDLFGDPVFISGYVYDLVGNSSIPNAEVIIRVVQEEEGFCSPDGAYVAAEIRVETDAQGFFTTYPDRIAPPENGHTEITMRTKNCETRVMSVSVLNHLLQHTGNELPSPEKGNIFSLECADPSENLRNSNQ